MHAGIYLVLGIAAILISMPIKKKIETAFD